MSPSFADPADNPHPQSMSLMATKRCNPTVSWRHQDPKKPVIFRPPQPQSPTNQGISRQRAETPFTPVLHNLPFISVEQHRLNASVAVVSWKAYSWPDSAALRASDWMKRVIRNTTGIKVPRSTAR
eukprot:719974-Rhodomonas_salina.2